MRICLQRHIRTKAHKKRSATVSPYVGIIQIRFRQHRGGAAFWSGRYSPLSARFTQAPLLYKFTVAQFVVFCKAFASFFAKPLDIKPGFHAMLETAERQK